MAVRPVAITPNGMLSVVHDEAGHQATMSLTDLKPGRKPDGTPDYRFTVMACPVPGCGAVSVHPCSGGCDPDNVQRLFAHLILANPAIPARTWQAAKQLLRKMVEDLDGPGRWRIEDVTENE